MTTSKHVQLVERLYDRTNEGKLAWAETSEPGTFLAAFSNFSVEISTEPSFDETDYRFVIRNSNGDIIESVTDRDMSAAVEDTSIPRSGVMSPRKRFFQRCEQLYQMARRSALGTDKALDSILGDLASEGS